jgi:DNA-binding response OmpR family regulator
VSSGGTVVIADDDADIRALIALSVTRAGAVVAADVATGSAALLAIKRCVPDLAILDVSMPEMTGLQVCRAVRADPTTSDIRILVLSAAVHPAAVAEGGAAGADAYELKPFSPRTLSKRIREMLQARRAEATDTESATRFVAPEE